MASNNIVTIRNDRDLFDSFKRLKSIDSSVNDKLTAEQQEAILANRALLLCLMNKPEEARASIAVLKERFPVSKIASDLIVFLATKDQSPIVAIELLKVSVTYLIENWMPSVADAWFLPCRMT